MATKQKIEKVLVVEGQSFNEEDIRTLVGWSALTLVNPDDIQMTLIKMMLKRDITKLLMDKNIIGRNGDKKHDTKR